jgi:hypothetical protein
MTSALLSAGFPLHGPSSLCGASGADISLSSYLILSARARPPDIPVVSKGDQMV